MSGRRRPRLLTGGPGPRGNPGLRETAGALALSSGLLTPPSGHLYYSRDKGQAEAQAGRGQSCQVLVGHCQDLIVTGLGGGGSTCTFFGPVFPTCDTGVT